MSYNLLMQRIKKILPILICFVILIYIFFYTPYPESWQQASTFQILAIFIPLLIIFTLLIEIKLKYLPKSFIVGMGLTLLLIFQALNVLTPLLVIAVLALSILLARLYPKHKLTLGTKIPKLTKLGARKK